MYSILVLLGLIFFPISIFPTLKTNILFISLIARILYSPRIARIQEGGKKVFEFLDFLPKKFYLDDKFPVNYVDGKNYIFLGSDKSGKVLKFYKVNFE
jgi:hypothetical protein